jgi:hypothetical protein
MDWYIWIIMGIVGSGMLLYVYTHIVKDWLDYRRAKRDIFTFVKSYKHRCNGANRFIVTVESLQDSFRIYNTTVITNVWLELIAEHVIEQDPQDHVWCIR